MTLMNEALSDRLGDVQQGVNSRDRKMKPQRNVGQGLESVPHVELLALFDLRRVATVKNIKQHDRDADVPGGTANSFECIGKEKASKALSLMPGVDSDHRYESCRYLTMARPAAREGCGQMPIIDAVCIEGVEADQVPVRRQQYKGPDIIRPRQFARRLAQIIVDLFDAGRKNSAIMPRRIERLDHHSLFNHESALLPAFDHLVVTRKGIPQSLRRRDRIFKRVEDRIIILSAHDRPLMGLDGFQRRFIGRVHHEGGVIHAAPGGGLLDRLLDMRLGPKIHADRAAFVDRSRYVLKRLHRQNLVIPVYRNMYAYKAHISSWIKGLSRRRARLIQSLAMLSLASIGSTPAHASKCEAGTIFNPITKVRWTCIFPITIGGVRVGSFDKLDKELDAQSASKPLCACRKGATFWFGVKVSFWSPNRMIDVVTEPGCMMALGADLLPTGGRLQGSQSSIADGTNSQKMFAQMHYYISPVWKMLDMFTDLPCIEDDGFDVAMITEVLPTWQSGTLGAIIQPEGILFGNPAAGLACMADSAAAAAGKVIDPLFWCMGSWGATYPVAGDIHFGDSVEAWAGLAARGTFMMGRLGALTISSADGCSFKAQPIWTKSRYKLQIMEPVKGGKCVNIGRPGALWSSGKHAPGKDNAQFMSFEKVICCAGVSTP